ncbi:GNAT family N-acetyltransferase [Nioella aestuarii]|uniref:GNAT family N-acetyltransferase n=1 Tax=Nioella aestuarii TaxID=1662864 RepID=UPI003D7F30A6
MGESHLNVTLDSITRPDVADLLNTHEALMRSQTPHASCHVKSADDLSSSGARMFSLREDERLLAIGALAPITPGHEELKSMHVRDIARGRGAGRALLAGMLVDACERGVTRISLETGSGDDHAAARALYASAGFVQCGPYAGYVDDPLSVFMTSKI